MLSMRKADIDSEADRQGSPPSQRLGLARRIRCVYVITMLGLQKGGSSRAAAFGEDLGD